MIEVVYVCNQKYELELFASIRSLILSGTSFTGITIFCVGKVPNYWKFIDTRIKVIQVNSKRPDFFLINKSYALSVHTETLVYLDSDTLVLLPIDRIISGCDLDFIGRPDSILSDRAEKTMVWRTLLNKHGRNEVPYFNSGFFIFQNGSHLGLEKTWEEITESLLADDYSANNLHGTGSDTKALSRHYNEQIGLSLALANRDLTYAKMSKTDHAYGWKNEPHSNRIVYHTGSPHYIRLSDSLQLEYNLFGKNQPVFTQRMNPLFTKRIKRYGSCLYRKFKQDLIRTLNQ